MLDNRCSADSRIMAYRPDIDGLRAVAVMAVIAYHFSRRSLPGGFLGVDIFFVLSGFLITSIILREISAGAFSIARFYGRRIRRILPALMTMLMLSCAAAWLVLLPSDLVGFAKSLFATLGFSANIYFWRDTNYFSSIADEKPLLHLWSLGVEEQYYLVFPLILLFLAKRSWALRGIAVLGIISLALNVAALKVDGSLPAFYLLPTRAWELAAGALCALAPPAVTPIAGYAGALLVSSALAIGTHAYPAFIPHPLPVVFGTALLVYGASGNHPVNRLLSCNALVFPGLISYSLYLWHWPILVFCKYYLVRDLTTAEQCLAALLMLVLSILSWRFIERPFRESDITMKTVSLIVLAGTIALGLFAGTIVYRSGFSERFSAVAAKMSEASGTNYRCAVSDYLDFEGSKACALALPSREPKDADVVLFGNSHALMYAPLVREIARDDSLSALLVWENGCPPTYGVNISRACKERTDRNIDDIVKLKRARLVLIGSTWNELAAKHPGRKVPSPGTMLNALDGTIDRLLASGKQVVLIGPLDTPGWDVASIASRSLAFGRPLTRPLYGSLQAFRSRYSNVIDHFERRSDITLARPDLAQCASGRCDYVIDGRSLFADSHHLAQAQLGFFRPAFETAVKKALARQ